MNHLALVSNCQMDTVGQGEKRQKASFRTVYHARNQSIDPLGY